MSAALKLRKQEKKKTAHLCSLLYFMKVYAAKSGCKLGWRTVFRAPWDQGAMPMGVDGPEEKAAPLQGVGRTIVRG